MDGPKEVVPAYAASPWAADARGPTSVQDDSDSEAVALQPPMRLGGCGLFDPTVPRIGRIFTAAVIVLWLCVVPFMILFAPKFNKATSSDFDAPKGSNSAKAIDAQSNFFSSNVNNGTLVFFVQDVTGGSVIADGNCTTNPVCQFSHQLHDEVFKLLMPWSPLDLNSVKGYFLENAAPMQFVSGDNASTVITIGLGDTSSDKDYLDDFIDWLADLAGKAAQTTLPTDKYYVGVTGSSVLNKDAGSGTMKSTEQVERITFPIAFFVLACFIRSARLMIIPVLTILFCLGTTFTICYAVAEAMAVVTIAPALMMAATLAFNVDYNLFLLTRFRENATPVKVTVQSMQCAGIVLREGTNLVRKVKKGSEAALSGISAGFQLVAINGEQVQDGDQIKSMLSMTGHESTTLLFRMSLWDNVWKSVIKHTASETVLLSGTLVTIAFFAMALIPLNALYGLGICGGVAVFVCVMVNITLSPAMLLLFGEFFSGPCCCVPCDRWMESVRPPPEEDTEQLITSADPQAVLRKSCWYRFSELLQHYPLLWVVVVLGAGAPLWIRFPDNLDATRINADPLEFAPRDADSVHTWRRMGEHFDQGKFQPYYFIMVNNSVPGDRDGYGDISYGQYGVFTPAGYIKMLQLIKNVSKRTKGVPMRSFYGPVVLPQVAPKEVCPPQMPESMLECGADYTAINLEQVSPAVQDEFFKLLAEYADKNVTECERQIPAQFKEVCPILDVYKGILKTSVSQPLHKAMTVQCFTPFQPTGLEAMEWMNDLQDVLDDFRTAYPGFEIHLAGGNAKFHDFNKTVNKDMPRMIGILLAVVFVIVCAVFRSVMIGIIMAVTIAFSVGSAFGLGYYVFQTDSFHWLFTFLSDFNNQGLNWSVVPMCFAITVALAMDYDVFILTRIYELRRRDMTTADSVKEAMWGVSGTIAGAGCIMAIAFGGLMFTTVVSLNQFGVLLTVSILIDTFLMCTIVVPASMLAFKRYSWFPGPLWKEDGQPAEVRRRYSLME
eukprot:TRINITY_DN6926_c5_g1_i1.p1 TRINITY_DN6926_c5_g1~~TRINITY_DN6926_c5_g1_i1.p1  ORF type:complete len:1031 (+),score=405.80 TRINITY_DN6926_c5_g1_i1:85-3093(+)